jgi:PAS domain S-box-containing protein
MKKMLFLILCCLAWLPGGRLFAAQAPWLILGNDRLPPFTWLEDRHPAGLAVELTRAAAAKAGLTIRIEGRPWAAAQEEVAFGAADALLHISPDAQREKLFDFSDPLIESHFAIFRLSQRTEIQGGQSLQGKTVGVEDGGFPQLLLRRDERIALVLVANWQAGFRLLAAGKIDAIVVDRSVGEWVLRSDNIHGVSVLEPTLLTSTSRIAVKKGNRALLAGLNQGLAAIAQDGTRQEILERWRAQEVVYVARQTVSRLAWVALGLGLILIGLALAYAWKTRKANQHLAQQDARLRQEIQERELAQKSLQLALQNLDQRVAERTAALAASEEHFRLLVEQSPDGIFVADSAGRYTDVNSVGAAMLGYTRDELLTRSIADVLVAGQGSRIALEVGRFAAGGVVTSEWLLQRKDGSNFLGEVHGRQLSDGRLQAILRDITQRRAAEQALRSSEEQYRKLFLNMVEELRVWQIVRDEYGSIQTWRLVDANPPALKAWGRQSVDDVRGQTADEILGPGTTAHFLPVVHKIMADGRPHTFEDEPPNHDQYYRFSCVQQGDGFITTAVDISALKKAEALLQEERDRLTALIGSISDEIWFVDVQGRFTLVNPATRTAFNWAPGALAADFQQLVAGLDLLRPDGTPRPVAESPPLRALQGEIVTNQELVIRTQSSGQLHYRQINAAPVRNAAGQIIGSVSVARDITEQKREAQRLSAALQEADRANNAKSRFLAAASHDLRQPLSAISLYAHMLKTTPRPADQKLVANMLQGIASLSVLLDDLRDLSKLDAGVVTPVASHFPVTELFDELVSAHWLQASAKGLALRSVPSAWIAHTDRVLLRRMLGNLLDNALSYTERGGVLIGCRRRLGKTWIEVWDTGIGIPPGQTGEIFEEFRQLGDGARNKGSGLGLAIVARTAALLGLAINVRSRLGHGSVFAIELPLGEAPTASPLALPAAETPRSLRIIFVEDNAMVREAMVLSLDVLGHEVLACASGADMLAKLGAFKPDIVLSDYRLMQGETGLDVIASVRERFGADLPAILITGDTAPGLLRNIGGRGIKVVHKPVSLERLQAHLEELTG